MHEPDFTYDTSLAMSIETATQNLSENLHLKWNFGLLYVDKYTDESGAPVSIVTGLHKKEETLHHIRVILAEKQKSTLISISIWKVMMAGYPLPKSIAVTDKSDAVDLIDEVIQFCEIPFKEGKGIVSWLSNLFSGTSEKRKYEDTAQ